MVSVPSLLSGVRSLSSLRVAPPSAWEGRDLLKTVVDLCKNQQCNVPPPPDDVGHPSPVFTFVDDEKSLEKGRLPLTACRGYGLLLRRVYRRHDSPSFLLVSYSPSSTSPPPTTTSKLPTALLSHYVTSSPTSSVTPIGEGGGVGLLAYPLPASNFLDLPIDDGPFRPGPRLESRTGCDSNH